MIGRFFFDLEHEESTVPARLNLEESHVQFNRHQRENYLLRKGQRRLRCVVSVKSGMMRLSTGNGMIT
jgi:hypothetical protein